MQVAVIIPTYNRSALVSRAVESVLRQTADDIEIVVVDDGSTDGTRQIIESIAAQSRFPIRYLWKPNGGCASARNVGLRETHADAFLFLDSDDALLPEAVASLTEVLEQAQADFVYSPTVEVITGRERFVLLPVSAGRPEDIAVAHFFDGSVRNGAVLFRHHVLERAGLVDESLRYNEDSDFFQRVSISFKAAYCPVATVEHYHHAGNKSSNRVAIYRAMITSAQRILDSNPSFRRRLGASAEKRLAQLQGNLVFALITTARYEEAREMLRTMSGPTAVVARIAIGLRWRWPVLAVELVRKVRRRLVRELSRFSI